MISSIRCTRSTLLRSAGLAALAASGAALTGARPAAAEDALEYLTLLSRGPRPGIVRWPAAAVWRFDPLTELPHYDPNSSAGWQVDLRQQDLSSMDLTDRLDDLLHADFDSRTRWPRLLPAGFDPTAIMTAGRNPGLRVRSLHRRGITGRGVGIAIIDQPLLVEHQEYRGQLRSYEEIHVPKDSEAQMHGPAVASIAVGRSTGVAPAAELYYIAETHGTYASTGFNWDFTWLARSIDRILEINRRLPMRSRIRVISCSVGWWPSAPGYAEANAAVARARAAGVFVISTNIESTYNLAFHGLGRDPRLDPDETSSYGLGSWWGAAFRSGENRFPVGTRLLAPMDSRTTASPTGCDEYAYYPTGGWSWTVPYLAGLYALACQVDPDITPERFWATGLATGTVVTIPNGSEQLELGNIVQPTALIAALAGR